MDDEQPVFKVVDRRPFNPDGSPRDVPPEEREEASEGFPDLPLSSESPSASSTVAKPAEAEVKREPRPAPHMREPEPEPEPAPAGRDPLDDPASFLSLIMSLASNAAASLGMMPHPVTGETGVDLKTAKHWVDVLGMLEQKTRGNLTAQEHQIFEGLLADLRMQYVSFSDSPPPAKFSASDITGGK